MLGYVGTRRSASAPPAQAVNPIDKRDVVERYRRAVNLLATDDLKGAIDQFKALGRSRTRHAESGCFSRHGLARRPRRCRARCVSARDRARTGKPGRVSRRGGGALAPPQTREAAARAQHVADDAKAECRRSRKLTNCWRKLLWPEGTSRSARAEAALAEEADPNRPVRAYVDGRNAFERRRYAEALELFEPALEKVEKTPRRPLADLRLVTGRSACPPNRLSEAEYLFLEELKQSPYSDRARAGLIAVYKATGRTTEAAALAAQH